MVMAPRAAITHLGYRETRGPHPTALTKALFLSMGVLPQEGRRIGLAKCFSGRICFLFLLTVRFLLRLEVLVFSPLHQ